MDPRPPAEVLPLCRAGDRLRAVQPAGQGILNGTVDTSTEFTAGDVRGTVPRFDADKRAANLALVDRVRDLARSDDVTPGQVAVS